MNSITLPNLEWCDPAREEIKNKYGLIFGLLLCLGSFLLFLFMPHPFWVSGTANWLSSIAIGVLAFGVGRLIGEWFFGIWRKITHPRKVD